MRKITHETLVARGISEQTMQANINQVKDKQGCLWLWNFTEQVWVEVPIPQQRRAKDRPALEMQEVIRLDKSGPGRPIARVELKKMYQPVINNNLEIGSVLQLELEHQDEVWADMIAAEQAEIRRNRNRRG